jgi:toxin ParE1/3/4
MARHKLQISQVAEEDLAGLYGEGIRTWGQAQADRYYDALIEHFDRLCENPLLYRAVNEIRPGYRRSVCGRHAVYYRILGETVEIMAVIKHQSIIDRLD